MNKKNSNLLKTVLVITTLISAVYFFTKESSIEKEQIQITNNINNEKENNANVGGVSGSDINTNNNQQSSSTNNTQKEVIIKKEIKNMKTAIFKTNMGNIEIELDFTNTPKTAENFAKLAGEGFYDGVRFHRVISNFMIQSGDPLSKDMANKNSWGTGGPGYQFADEIKTTNKNNIGTISMANSGPNTNGSQFFINTGSNNFLDPKHTVFGKVTKGLDVVTKIQDVSTDERDRPLSDVTIESITLK